MADLMAGDNKTNGQSKTLIEALAGQGPEALAHLSSFDQESKIKFTVESLAKQTAETLARIEEIQTIMSEMKSGGTVEEISPATIVA